MRLDYWLMPTSGWSCVAVKRKEVARWNGGSGPSGDKNGGQGLRGSTVRDRLKGSWCGIGQATRPAHQTRPVKKASLTGRGPEESPRFARLVAGRVAGSYKLSFEPNVVGGGFVTYGT